MGEAAPQAAGGTGTEDIAKALDVLLLLWDDEFPAPRRAASDAELRFD